jgi:hypothetical protein
MGVVNSDAATSCRVLLFALPGHHRQPRSEARQHELLERQKRAMRSRMRRFMRLTNHVHIVSLYTVWYNFVRVHKTLRMTPAMSAGVSGMLRDIEWIAALIEVAAPKPGPRGPYRKRPA